MNLPDGSPKGKRALSGARQTLIGLGLLLLSYGLWLGRDFLPALATTRVVATAVLSASHGSSGADLQRAFEAAKEGSPAEATLEPEQDPAIHGVAYLSVTADTSDQARAHLAALVKDVQSSFPSAGRSLSVSLNDSTTPAPNDLSRVLSIGVRAVTVLMMGGCEFLLVVGARRQGYDRIGLLVAIATPFSLLLLPGSGSTQVTSMHTPVYHADWQFVLLQLAVTPVAVILGLWVTREKRGSADRRRS